MVDGAELAEVRRWTFPSLQASNCSEGKSAGRRASMVRWFMDGVGIADAPYRVSILLGRMLRAKVGHEVTEEEGQECEARWTARRDLV